jgi:glutamine amidotransferase/cyclase
VKPIVVHVLDYGAGNVRSITNAIERVGFVVQFVSSPSDLESASILVFPGVGCFASAIDFLDSAGYREPLLAYLRSGRPFMGICLGMQTLFESSDEAPGKRGLGLISGNVGLIKPSDGVAAVPHMGWNGVARVRAAGAQATPALAGVEDSDRVYFVHSYAARVTPANAGWIATVTDYGGDRFISSVSRGAVFATQFHPEKSSETGLKIFKDFLTFAAKTVAAAAPTDSSAAPVDANAAAAILDPALTPPKTCVARRIIACLDVRSNDAGDLVVTKGDQYDVRESVGGEGGSSVSGGVRNLGKPVDLCARYYDEGADEVCFLNITAFRAEPLADEPMLRVLELASARVFVPLTVRICRLLGVYAKNKRRR